eukprot:TRINITY_DN3110_c0_g1_i1.p1 TRINITY_DN3110_c0_g1~~TRINITY_DN3110_c0_g1_i1.p1  ORF type:complete len:185 (+),score=20.43 TRINITY_DN3110_c0_g1_i1:697-1251(+)
MSFAWGFLLPFGVVFARYQRENPRSIFGKPVWFSFHRIAQLLGWLVQVTAFVSVFIHVQQLGIPHFTGDHKTHKLLGLVVVIASTLQVLVAFIRPPPGSSRHRVLWEWFHKFLGFGLLALGAAAAATGLIAARNSTYRFNTALVTAVPVGILFIVMLIYAVFAEIKGVRRGGVPSSENDSLRNL